jgi:hypothetical protein
MLYGDMIVRLANLPLGTELPKQLKLLYDVGPEKWCDIFLVRRYAGGY